MSEGLKIGWIPYWNLHPFKHELQKQRLALLEIKTGVPTMVNRWLLDGTVQMAPSSSVCLISSPNIEIALPLGISTDGPVRSVYWGLQAEHLPFLENLKKQIRQLQVIFNHAKAVYDFEARRMAAYVFEHSKEISSPFSAANPLPLFRFTHASASSAALSRTLLYLLFGKDAYVYMQNQSSLNISTTRPIDLLIGDEALERRCQFHTIVDLGTLWKELTGFPFVFSVWQSRGGFLNGWRRKIQEVGERAETIMKAAPNTYIAALPPLDEQSKCIALADYWKAINYKLGAKEFKGLLLFLCLTRHLQALPDDNDVIVKLTRWQELSQTKLPTHLSL